MGPLAEGLSLGPVSLNGDADLNRPLRERVRPGSHPARLDRDGPPDNWEALLQNAAPAAERLRQLSARLP